MYKNLRNIIIVVGVVMVVVIMSGVLLINDVAMDNINNQFQITINKPSTGELVDTGYVFNNHLFHIQRYYIFLLLVASVGTAIFVLLRFMSNYIDSIKNAIFVINNIAAGNYNNTMDISNQETFPELNELIDSVNTMSCDIEHHISVIERNYLEMVELIANAVEMNDEYTFQHSMSVADYAKMIGKAIRYEDIEILDTAARLHDIGKISIPTDILNKPGKLTEEEYDLVKKHTTHGAKLIAKIEYFDKVSLGVKYHHERYDGTGYPEGLKGDEIPLIAQIISLADVYDALTSDRSYRDAMSHQEAMYVILENSGKMFNPRIVDAFYVAIEGFING